MKTSESKSNEFVQEMKRQEAFAKKKNYSQRVPLEERTWIL